MTCRSVQIHKTCPQRKLAKCEWHVIETLISNSLTGKELFYHLNEQFVSNRAGNIIFCDKRSYQRATENNHFSRDVLMHGDTCIYTSFLRGNISKRERRAAETLINNSFVKERVFLPFEWTICVK